MTNRSRLYTLTSSLVAVGLIAAPCPTLAQTDPAGGYGQPSADPPARVARLAVIQGTVSQHGPGEDHWSPAVLNAPAATGDAIWTEPQALAELEIGSSSLWLNSQTELDLSTIDDTQVHATEPQGEAYLHLRALQPSDTYTVETPRGSVTLAADGRYAITAGDTQTPTTVSVLEGAAQITGNNISLQVHANQTASITGETSFEGSVGPMVQDAFVDSVVQREQPPRAHGVAAPAVVAQMTGGADLDAYGAWDNSADYGNVWYPSVDSGWAPYRDGRWSYVAPWGWTWVDAAPWGFAPFHYGRWVQIGPRWGWAPGYPGYGGGYRPVYAPALVSFFGVGGGVGVGVGIGVGIGLGGAAFGLGSTIGWVPLGPREPYYPPYGGSRGYVERVNITNVRNVTNIYNEAGRPRPIAQFANARAATVVPATAMTESHPIAAAYRRPTPTELSAAHGVVGRPPIAPGGRTLGLTPRVAQQLKVPNVQQRRAPGPQVAAAAPGAPHPTAAPALRPASPGAPAGTRPGIGLAGQPPIARPVGSPGPAIGTAPHAGALPTLRSPGQARPLGERPAALPAAPPARTGSFGRPAIPTGSPGPRPGTPVSPSAQPAAAERAPRVAATPRAVPHAPAAQPRVYTPQQATRAPRAPEPPRAPAPPRAAPAPVRPPVMRQPERFQPAPPPRPQAQPRPAAAPPPAQRAPERPDRKQPPR